MTDFAIYDQPDCPTEWVVYNYMNTISVQSFYVNFYYSNEAIEMKENKSYYKTHRSSFTDEKIYENVNNELWEHNSSNTMYTELARNCH